MTTLAYCDGVIAYDSRATADTQILSDNCDKRSTRDGVKFFFAGAIADRDKFIDAYFGDECDDDLSASAFVVDGNALYRVGWSDGKLFKELCDLNEPVALGSGSDHAITAMDCGRSAKEAVKMAMKRDTNTGGKIRTFKL